MKDAGEPDLWMGIHIGYLAGQTVPHLHWHLLRTTTNPPEPTKSGWSAVRRLQTEKLTVAQNDMFVVSAGGVRAGGLIIAPKEYLPFATGPLIVGLASALHDAIALGSHKFVSTQGLRPDFKAAIHLHSGYFDLAEYVPILNQWGFTESYQLTFGPIQAVPFILPWPHFVTAEYLRA
jgi:hypothetical protein